MRTTALLLFFLLWCEDTESLTHKRVHLGENMTLDCQIDNNNIYWVFQKLSDSPVVILRTFTSESTSAQQEERFKDKYSSLTRSRLFISNLTINELGIYYCAKTVTPLKLSSGTRLYITETAKDQNQTNLNNNSQCPNAEQSLTLLYFIPIIVMCLAVIGLQQIKLQGCRKKQGEPKRHNIYEEFSEVEFCLFQPTNNTFRKNPGQI